MKQKIKVTKSSGNIFADIGIPNADEHFVKAEIVLDIAARIKAKKLTQAQAAKIMALSQPDVSKLLRGNFAGYTLDRLFSFLRALGNDVRIQIVPTKGKKAGQLELGSGVCGGWAFRPSPADREVGRRYGGGGELLDDVLSSTVTAPDASDGTGSRSHRRLHAGRSRRRPCWQTIHLAGRRISAGGWLSAPVVTMWCLGPR